MINIEYLGGTILFAFNNIIYEFIVVVYKLHYLLTVVFQIFF